MHDCRHTVCLIYSSICRANVINHCLFGVPIGGPIDIVVKDIKKVTENCNILLKFNKKLFVYCQNLLKTVVLAVSGENIARLALQSCSRIYYRYAHCTSHLEHTPFIQLRQSCAVNYNWRLLLRWRWSLVPYLDHQWKRKERAPKVPSSAANQIARWPKQMLDTQ